MKKSLKVRCVFCGTILKKDDPPAKDTYFCPNFNDLTFYHIRKRDKHPDKKRWIYAEAGQNPDDYLLELARGWLFIGVKKRIQ